MAEQPVTEKPKGNSNVNCCVVGCHNTYSNCPVGTHFYKFPNDKQYPGRRDKWLSAVRRKGPDGKSWSPGPNSKVCSDHFVGGCKKDHPTHPAFIPTLMPASYKKSTPRINSDRFDRYIDRRVKVSLDANLQNILTQKFSDLSVQTDVCSNSNASINFMFCAQNGNDLSTQTDLCASETTATISRKTQTVAVHVPKKTDQICGPDYSSDCCFTGFPSIRDEEEMCGLAGVSTKVYVFLQNRIPEKHYFKVSRENRLLMFLMRMKHGLTYTALASIFGIHRTSASKIFIEILNCLLQSLSSLVFWPDAFSIKSTMPPVFKNYPCLRAIIDCTELRSERPPRVDQQVLLYSSYKGTYTIKYLVAITPSGMVSFISRGYGGRTTDGFITTDCGFLNLVERGDEIMADKGFPEIRTQLDSCNVTLVMPPFAHQGNEPFTEEEVEDTYKIASVRIHVERCIARLRIYKILDKISVDMLPYVDGIMRLCCVLVNLQRPIIVMK